MITFDTPRIANEAPFGTLDGLDLSTQNLSALAEYLRQHGAAHLSAIERIDLAENLTRRRFLIGAGALVLAGCSVPSASVPTATSDRHVRTINHQFGTTTVSGTPERIVAVGDGMEIELLLGLGIVPVQVHRYAPDTAYRPWVRSALTTLGAEPEVVPFLTDTPNLEAVAAARPDIIVGQMSEDSYTQLAQIAPAIAIDSRDWRATLQNYAVLFDKQAGAANLTRTWDTAIADAKARLSFTGKKLGIISAGYEQGTFIIFGLDRSPQAQFFAELGAGNVADTFMAGVSPERIDILAPADGIIVLNYTSLPGEDPASNVILAQLPAVVAGRYIVLTEDESFSLVEQNPLKVDEAVKTAERVASVMR